MTQRSGWRMDSTSSAGPFLFSLLLFWYLSVCHPLFDFISAKTVIAADLEKWNSAIAHEFVDCGPMKLEILSYFGNRHDLPSLGKISGVHARDLAETIPKAKGVAGAMQRTNA